MSKWLTKSNYVYDFLVSPALLWLKKHDETSLPQVTEDLQLRFDTGNALTALARDKFPGGVLVMEDTINSIEATTAAMTANDLVYEGAVLANDRLYARADILMKAGDVWDMYEVKSGASYHRHQEYLLDMAFQYLVFKWAGVRMGRQNLVLVNTHYEREGLIDPHKLFYIEDVTGAIPELLPQVEANIEAALEVIDSHDCPPIEPLNCENMNAWLPIYEHLKGELPAESIFRLANLTIGTARRLKEAGMKLITDIEHPEQFKLSAFQRGQWEAARNGKPTIHPERIANHFGQLNYPLYFLDYETVGPAIPMYEGTRPYQTIPFQYSLQVLDAPGATPRELKFLHKGQDNPMPYLLKQLQNDIGGPGSIVAWSNYEGKVHNALAAHYPESRDFLEDLNGRIFDLSDIFREQMYVDYRFLGKFSIKNVLPVLVPELSYEDLEIGEGMIASSRWQKAVSSGIGGAEAEKVFSDLELYCGRDTLAMVRILEFLITQLERPRQ